MDEREWTVVALVASLGVGLLVSTVITGGRVDGVQDRAGRLERRAVVAEANAEQLAERLVVLTDRWNESAEMLERLSAACVASGGCVEVDDGK